MKKTNLKTLMPIILAVGMVLSIYMLINTRTTTAKEYKQYIADAQNYATQGIVVKAEESYRKALSMKSSLDLYLAMAQVYVDNDDINGAISCGEEILDTFPKDVESYEFMAQLYRDNDMLTDSMTILKEAKGRKLSSDKLTDIYNTLKYEYQLGSRSFDDIGYYSGGFWTAKKKGSWGFLTSTGSSAVGFKYESVDGFVNDQAPVKEPSGAVYYIDTNGDKISVVSEEIGAVKLGMKSDPIAITISGNKTGYYSVDKEGSYVYKFGSYDYAGVFSDGVAAIKEDGTWSIINKSGEKISDKNYTSVALDDKGVVYRNERAFVCVDGKFIMIDGDCKQVGDSTYIDAKPFYEKNSYAAVEIGDKWGFVDKNGELKIEAQYDNARSFAGGYAAVCKDGKWGFINTDGEICIDYTFDAVKDFSVKGVTFVCLNETWQSLKLISRNY